MTKKIYLNLKDKPFLRMVTVEIEDMGYEIASLPTETNVLLIISECGFVPPSKNCAPILVLDRETAENTKYFLKRPFDITALRSEVIRLTMLDPLAESEPENTDRNELSLDIKRRIATFGKNKVSFTDAEFTLLKLLYEKRGETVTDAEITEKVWGKDTPDSNITAVYINYLREKLFKICELPLIKRVRGVGYTMENR